MVRTDVAGEIQKIVGGEMPPLGGELVNSTLVKFLDGLGYDIELRLVDKRVVSSRPPEKQEKIPSRIARYHKQYVYRLTFPNGKVYIGTAWDIRKRWDNNGAGYRSQKVWKQIQLFGWENIKKEILLYIPFEEQTGRKDPVREMEKELIRANEGNCYNEQCTSEYHMRVATKNKVTGKCTPRYYWEIDGIRKPAKEWCHEYGKHYSSVKNKIDRYGLTPKQALTVPPVPSSMSRRAMEYWCECGCFNEENSCRA